MERAHDLSREKRTLDVAGDEELNFSDMLLSDNTLKGLEAAGFKKPSPIQRKAIPFGRCGFDLIVQAKSGTGKTCVFTVIAMEMVNPSVEKLQVVVLAPTREISVQIANVMSSISNFMKRLKVEVFIGGLPFEQDKKKARNCQIAVGAPGRMKHLISDGFMDVNSVRLFVLDEADRLMEENFREDISYIFTKLPSSKQVIAASATFPEELENFVAKFMKKLIKISPGDETILLGVRQFVYFIPPHPLVSAQLKNKTVALKKILSAVPFKQCLVFSNYQSWAETMCDELTGEGWPAIFINGSQTQMKRLSAFSSLKEYRCRVLLSTDLTARGIDAENVNLIVNLDLPYDGATYLHRIGRAGRYGTYGIALTIVQEGEEVDRFRNLLYQVGGESFNISVFPKEKLCFDIWSASEDQFEKLESLSGVYKYVKEKEPDKIRAEKTVKEGRKNKKDEAVSVISKIQVQPAEKLVLGNWESLKCDFNNFEMEGEGLDVENEVKLAVRNVPKQICSYLVYLENNGWKLFYKGFNEFKKKNLEDKMVSPQVVNENENENEYENSFKVEEESKYSEEEYSSDSEESLISCDNYHEFVENNYALQDWYSLWMNQCRIIKNYVQYFHYWKGIINI